MDNLSVFAMASNHPDPINKYESLFNKWSIEAIVRKGVEVKAIIPRPYSPPFSKYSRIPKKDLTGLYPIYYPRFWYLLPKRMFYGFAGKSYFKNVSKFLEDNLSIPDLVHAFHLYLDGYGALKYCKKNNLPLIATAHGEILRDIWEWRKVRDKLEKTIKYSSKVLCVSKDLSNLAEKRGINPSKIEVVPIGVDTQLYQGKKKDQTENVYSVRNILFVGQFIPRKGIKTLLEVIVIITSKYKNVNFLIAGFGGNLQAHILKFISKMDLQKNVKLLNNISTEKLQKLYSVADIFILPSLAEGRPTVIYEAMASECVIVATSVGGIPEQVKEGYNGFLVEPENAKILAEKISYLLENEKEMIRMGKNSRNRIIEKGWTWGEYAKKVISIYQELL